MKIDFAILCDAVTVREGLLHILGGGVTRIGRQEFPSPMMTQVGVRLFVAPEEADSAHVLMAELFGPGDPEAPRPALKFEFTMQPNQDLSPGEHHSLAVQMPIQGMPLSAPGQYTLELSIDGEVGASIAFVAGPLPKADLTVDAQPPAPEGAGGDR